MRWSRRLMIQPLLILWAYARLRENGAQALISMFFTRSARVRSSIVDLVKIEALFTRIASDQESSGRCSISSSDSSRDRAACVLHDLTPILSSSEEGSSASLVELW